jgi:hypothetical protein
MGSLMVASQSLGRGAHWPLLPDVDPASEGRAASGVDKILKKAIQGLKPMLRAFFPGPLDGFRDSLRDRELEKLATRSGSY